MKRTPAALLLLASLLPTAWAQGTFDAITAFTPGSISGPIFGTAGWTFQPSIGIQVTELGCLDFVITDQGPITVGFWNSAGTLLASATISGTNELSGQTRYAAVAPFFLSAGATYTLGAYWADSPNGSISVTIVGPPPDLDGSVALANPLQLGASVSGAGGFVFPETALGPAGSMALGPTFRFRDIPEPSAFAFVVLSSVLLLFRRR